MLNALLTFIFIRPFISGVLFPALDIYYSLFFLLFSLFWLISKKKFIFRGPVRYPFIFFFASIILSVFISPDIAQSLKSLPKYLTYLTAFCIAAQADNKERRRIILTIISASVLVGLIGLCQRILNFPVYLFDFSKKFLEQGRIYAAFVTPTVFGGYLILIIPIIAGLLYEKKRGFIVQPLSYLAAALALCLFLTKSIGAFLGLTAGLIIFFICNARFNKKTLALSLTGFVVILFMLIVSRNYFRPETLPEFSVTIMQRKMFWHDTWEVIKKFPIKGTGLGNFSISGTNFAHNSYIQIWAEMGILAVLSFLWFIFIFLMRGFLRLKTMKLWAFPDTKILSGLLASVCAFLVHNYVDFTFFTPEVAVVWWLICGLIISFCRASRSSA